VPYQSIYDSAWHHPGLAWVGALVAAILFARKQRFLAGWFAIFLVVAIADAFFTGPFSTVPPRHAWIAGVVFVILGDLRFFALTERFVRGRFDLRAAGVSLGVALIVPVTTEVLRRVVPAIGATPRLTFLTYEVLFLALALVLRFSVLPARLLGLPGPIRHWALRLATFEVVQYFAWVACDVLIVAGIAPALLLRIVPNALYYAAFLPFAVLTAPPVAWGEPAGRLSRPG
jgi:hypothetical protein